MSRRLLIVIALAGAGVTAAAIALELFAQGYERTRRDRAGPSEGRSPRSGSSPA